MIREEPGPLLGHEESNTTDIYARKVEVFDRPHWGVGSWFEVKT